MEIRNFSYFLKFNFFLLALLGFLLGSCQSIKTRNQVLSESEATTPPSNRPDLSKSNLGLPVSSATPTFSEPEREVPSAKAALAPKIGLILGPGSARAYAHVGVVQELAKAKLPITHVIGLEMGALVGAIYASKAQPFDVEWQMFKLKDFNSVGPLLQGVFQTQKVEDFKIPFACPAFNLEKQQNFMMNKGVVTQMLPYCLPYPPLMKPYNQNVAGLTEMKAVIDYLKSKGANYIVYVNILKSKGGVITGSLEDESNVLWSLASQNLSKQWTGVDYVISVPVQDFDLLNFEQRRQMMQKGIEVGQGAASRIARKLGL
jgi:NTE family protein